VCRNIKENIKLIVKNNKTYDYVVGLTFIVAVLLFYLFRPDELLILFSTTLLWIFVILAIKFNILKQQRKLNKFIIPILGTAYLVYSYFNSRVYSYDGGLYHLKYMLLVVEKWFVATTEYPVRPYLGEYVFALIYKFLGLRKLNLALGISTLLSIYQAKIIIKELTKDSLERNLSLALFIFSPTFISLSTREIKPDMLACNMLFCIFILFIKHQKGEYVFLPLIGLLCGLSVLVKTSTLFVIPWVMLLGIITLIKTRVFLKTKLLLIFLTSVSSILPLITWFVAFGGTIPQIENNINIKPLIHRDTPQVELERESTILNTCNEDKLKKDYSSFIYGSRSPLVLLQPLFYITRFKSYSFSTQQLAHPGIFLYLGMIALPTILIFKKRFEIDKTMRDVGLISLFSTIIFMVLVSSIFWYLLPLYPIYAIIISKLIGSIKIPSLKKILLNLCYLTLATNLIIGVTTATLIFTPIENLGGEEIKKTELNQIYEFNMRINSISDGSLILDASEHPFNINTMFVPNADIKIVKSNYYFASTDRPLNSLRNELLGNNIKFVVVNKDYLESPFYEGCPLKNNIKLLEFLEKYTEPVYKGETEYEKKIFRII